MLKSFEIDIHYTLYIRNGFLFIRIYSHYPIIIKLT